MKQLFKLKFKMHKLVNIIFYLIIFLIGFLIGLGVKKISFNNVLSRVLMIDNVSAYNIANNNGIVFNEEFIYNQFNNNFDDFDINTYHNIWCTYDKTYSLQCYAMTDETYNNLNFTISGSTIKYNSGINGAHIDLYNFQYYVDYYSYKSPEYKYYDRYTNGNFSYNGNCSNCYFNGYPSNLEENTIFSNRVLLNFNSFMKLEYNKTLFKDNPNFKEVCIDKGKKYAVTSTNIDPVSNTLFVSDFMWFPGKTTGVKYSEYDSLNDDNILIYNDDISTENYYFKDRETIDSIFNDEITSNYFNHAGYTDKYSYYGYTAYKFIHSYYVDDNNNKQNMFTIFDFSDINFSSFGSAGGSSSSFGDEPLTYCFYIKNEFNVTELKNDEWNDYTGVVPTPGGDLNVNTSYNKNNSNTNSSLSQPIIFINSMKDTINLINSLIYEFYMSLPVLLRTFIITLFIILIIMLIMRIGGY